MIIVMNDLVANAARWERLVVLTPLIVVAVGIAVGVFILLGRGFVETVRESRHPRLIIGSLLALAGVIVLLTYLGIELPREGG
jgi:hypothetical protein